jgi:hypothetical protein
MSGSARRRRQPVPIVANADRQLALACDLHGTAARACLTTFVTASITIEGSEIPALSIAAGIAGVGLILSFPLFAALTLRARVLPRWTALLMLAFMGAAAASMVPGVPERLNDLIVGIGLYMVFAGFGLALLMGARHAAGWGERGAASRAAERLACGIVSAMLPGEARRHS